MNFNIEKILRESFKSLISYLHQIVYNNIYDTESKDLTESHETYSIKNINYPPDKRCESNCPQTFQPKFSSKNKIKKT